MLSVGALSFALPWLLLGLAALPILWWLLRAVPPAPVRVVFPAIRLLLGLPQHEETPHRTPWWLLALRLLLAALVILALAHPILDPGRVLRGSGPLVLVIDNDWSAGGDWTLRRDSALALVDEAERENLPVYLATSARTPGTERPPLQPLTPAEARDRVRSLAPLPWPSDHAALLAQVEQLELSGSANAVWLSSGLSEPDREGVRSRTVLLERALQRLGALRIVKPAPLDLPLHLSASENTADGLRVEVTRLDATPDRPAALIATDEAGRLLARQEFAFPGDSATSEATVALPGELRNRISRVSVEGATNAGATMLFDESSRRRPVGLVSGDTAQVNQPLLGNAFYVNRALEPYAEVRNGAIPDLLERQLAVLVLSDIGNLTESQIDRLESWIARGGVLVRFAGPNLADGSDALLPVVLRRGGRVFGGVMSWERPATLAPFDETSPFAGLDVREEVVVRRQVLAQPSPDLAGKTWARLNDGTPLVTGEKIGDGWLVLFHTTANAEWSSLALSGLYVDMLRRLIALSQGLSADTTTRPLAPLANLDGFGRLGEPAAAARPLPAGDLADVRPGPNHPPGFYGDREARQAFNLGPRLTPVLFDSHGSGVETAIYGPSEQTDLRVWLLLAAFALLVIDMLISLGLRGHLPGRKIAMAGSLTLLLGATATTVGPDTADAQTSDSFALLATGETHLAYVLTGDTKIDETSRAGLFGLGQILARRTSIEPGSPIGLDVERDELAFFPLIYWPMTPGQRPLSDAARNRINEFLRNGGTIVFDTRDQNLSGIGGVGPGTRTLRTLVEGLDIPALIEVPREHVLTKAFYLLHDFPGRWEGGRVWVQQPDERVNDGVSSVIIGSNDYAAAWAIDVSGRPMFPIPQGGVRQRELAFRFGVNLVMYALTGNYKADQVHVDAILERLGQ
ncbi:MAG: DUF4159 domain-containing protein [Alphaproteobacteria bacterium]|nr:DUF4159 domain-containing protein [Alphaproteobacteria bacterium]